MHFIIIAMANYVVSIMLEFYKTDHENQTRFVKKVIVNTSLGPGLLCSIFGQDHANENQVGMITILQKY